MAGAAARGWIVAAAVSGAISVVVGAFAAHGLDLRTEAGLKAREWLQTGSHYEMIHALAILAVVVLSSGARLNGRLAASCLPDWPEAGHRLRDDCRWTAGEPHVTIAPRNSLPGGVAA